jgi:DNA-directed RNA polymerase specialized sigma subunit
MASKPDKTMIRLDYVSLGGSGTPESEIDRALVKKAKGFLGRHAREEISQLMDPTLRLLAAEVAQRQMKPELLYKIGQEGLLEAIKSYQPKQREGFREFATAFVRQSMSLAKQKMSREPAPPARPPIRQDELGAK